ncbi:hypothetical protein RN001_014414 [Aquatica leii]|uniref:Methyltransferase domain-containing protein n=1 Tax=Aquatica leii TaxID=1421715 RepID=A0AAN7SN53_9COLE|nr:hypothetical protein RN001_014414 [Aquatica leii]
MEKPLLYIKSSVLAQTTADYVLDKNLKMLQKTADCAVLDIGCGPGNITHDKILPLLPKSMKKLVGVDISGDSIEYARKHYQSDSRISFAKMDILIDEIPNEYVGAFDLVTSLFCFHYVSDHRKALTNIYKMLKPGSNVIISFMGKVLANILQYVHDNPKWTKYISNYKETVFIPQSEQYSKELFEELGFQQVQCDEYEQSFLHSEDELLGVVKSLNFFKVPEHLEKEFLQTHVDYLKSISREIVDKEGIKKYNMPYTLIVITACKSL